MSNGDLVEKVNVPNFILDRASEDDSFGQHGKVADAIIDVIESDDSINVIGLIGSWGSGKSTVVRLVEKGLDKHNDSGIKHYVFNYDAWLHQSDPQRRAFLDALISFLTKRSLLIEDKWREDADRLNGKIQDTIITNTPVLTPAGKSVLFALFLVPLGAVFSGHDWYTEFHNASWVSWSAFRYLIGLLFLVGPLLVIGFNCMRRKPTEEVLSVFMNKQFTQSKNRIIRDPDPTAIEFQSIFRKIMAEAAPIDGDTRLVFVIDNLDRLAPEDAIEMWASVRSFFLGGIETNDLPKATSIPKILLPIDETALTSIFSAHGDPAVASFVAKTFDLTFRITKPVLSGWDKFLNTQMQNVFRGNFKEEWWRITARFYHYLESSDESFRVTPRSLNKLVNDIATTWMQWRSDERISFAAISYYCVFRSSIDRNILTATASPVSGIDEIDENWARSIAALHYGVDPNDAEQVLIDQPLRNAIQNHDGKKFDQLTLIPGFLQTLSRICQGWRIEKSPEPDRALAVAKLLNDSSLSDVQTVQIFGTLRRVLLDTTTWKAFDQRKCDGLLALIPNGSETERGEYLKLVCDRFATADKQATDQPTFVGVFGYFWGKVQSEGKNLKALPQHIIVPGRASNFIGAGAEFSIDSPIRSRLRTQATGDELVSSISEEILQTADPKRTIEDFEFIKDLIKDSNLQPFLESLAQRMRAGPMQGPSITATVNVLGRLRNVTANAVAITDALCTEGHVNTRLATSTAQDDHSLTAALLALNLCSGIQFEVPNAGKWQAALKNNLEFVKQISECMTEFVLKKDKQSVVGVLQGAVTRSPNLRLIAKAVISYRVLINDLGTLNVAHVLKNLDKYLDLIDTEHQQSFFKAFERYETFWDTMSELPLIGDVSTVIKALIPEANKIGERAREWAETSLGKITVEDWKVTLSSGGPPYDVLRTLGTLTGLPIKVEALYEALDQLIPQVLSSADQAFRDRWFETSSFLGPEAKLTVLRNLRDKITLGSAITAATGLARAGGASFLSVEGFLESADNSVRHFIYPMLDQVDAQAVLSEFSLIFAQWIRTSKPETVAQLNKLFYRKLQGNASTAGQVNSLAIVLEIGDSLEELEKGNPNVD